MLNNFDHQQGKPSIVVTVYITPSHSLYPASVQAVSTAVAKEFVFLFFLATAL